MNHKETTCISTSKGLPGRFSKRPAKRLPSVATGWNGNKKEVPPVRAGLESGLYRMFHGMPCVLQYAITGCPRYQSAPTIEFWKDT